MAVIRTKGFDADAKTTISPTDYDDGVAYRKHPAIGQSDLKLFARCRRLFFERKIRGLWPQDSAPHFELGKMVEGMLLQPYMYQVVPRDVLSKSGARTGKRWVEWKAKLPPGVTPITEEQLAIKDAVYRSIERHPRVNRTLFEHKKHIHPRVIGWECPWSGLERKAEADLWLPDQRILVDIKTTVDPSPRAFDVEAWKFGYWIQAATYREAMQVADHDVKAYVIIAIRNKPPYDVEDHLVTQADMDEGDAFNRRWMQRLAEAIATDDWEPRTKDGIHVLQNPGGFHGRTWDDERLDAHDKNRA